MSGEIFDLAQNEIQIDVDFIGQNGFHIQFLSTIEQSLCIAVGLNPYAEIMEFPSGFGTKMRHFKKRGSRSAVLNRNPQIEMRIDIDNSNFIEMRSHAQIIAQSGFMTTAQNNREIIISQKF